MQKVLQQKEVCCVSVYDVVLTLLEMIDPVTTRILQVRWQAASNRTFVDLAS
jgi:hypothetical protein